MSKKPVVKKCPPKAKPEYHDASQRRAFRMASLLEELCSDMVNMGFDRPLRLVVSEDTYRRIEADLRNMEGLVPDKHLVRDEMAIYGVVIQPDTPTPPRLGVSAARRGRG
jgi:hypothetical protein